MPTAWVCPQGLITYNADDCKALSLILRTLDRISKLDFDVTTSVEPESDIVHEGSLGKNLASNWPTFKSPLSELEHINRAARWNYQRDRVFVRSGTRERKKQSRERAIKKAMSRRSCKKGPQIAVVLSGPTSCPKCGTQERTRHRLLSRVVYDLVFGRSSVKGKLSNTSSKP